MQIMSARVEKASHDEILGLNYFTFIREVGVNDSLAQIQDGKCAGFRASGRSSPPIDVVVESLH